MEITLTELEFAEKKIDNIIFNDIGVFGHIVVLRQFHKNGIAASVT